jgi:hypothetical protein
MEYSALIGRRSILVVGSAAAVGTPFIPSIALAVPADTRITVAAGQIVTRTRTIRVDAGLIASGRKPDRSGRL